MNKVDKSKKESFWHALPRPFFCLAPMADVTDAAFRQIIAKYGKPDVMWTEFVSVDGLCSSGRENMLADLSYIEGERPIVAQIFGNKPENFEKVARMLVEMGFDGIDINMGCPVKKILNQNSCSALIRTPELAREIVLATKRGAGNIPVSVKTRIGFDAMELDTWIPYILEAKPVALTVHLRTVKEMSKVPAHWEVMNRIVETRDRVSKDTLIIGNGDVSSLQDGFSKAQKTGCDGIMIGRAVFGNPWFFDKKRKISHGATFHIPILSWILPQKLIRRLVGDRKYSKSDINPKEKLKVLVEHCELFEKVLGDTKSFSIMKKHFKAYTHGFAGAKELRVRLMECNSAPQVKVVVENFLAGYTNLL